MSLMEKYNLSIQDVLDAIDDTYIDTSDYEKFDKEYKEFYIPECCEDEIYRLRRDKFLDDIYENLISANNLNIDEGDEDDLVYEVQQLAKNGTI